MALFLQETTQENTFTINVEESYNGLLDSVYGLQELNESLLIEDFILHEQSLVLTESDKLSKEVSFLTIAIDKIKKFILNVANTVSNFLIMVASKIQEIWQKLLIKLGATQTIEVPVGMNLLVNRVISEMTLAQKIAYGTEYSKLIVKDKITKSIANLSDLNTKLVNLFSSKSESVKEKITVNNFKKVIAVFAILATGKVISDGNNILKSEMNILDNELDGINDILEKNKNTPPTSPFYAQLYTHYEVKKKKIQGRMNFLKAQSSDKLKISGQIGKVAQSLILGLSNMLTNGNIRKQHEIAMTDRMNKKLNKGF